MYRIKESDKAQRQNNISKIDFINDKVDTIEALCENADSIEEVLTRINNIFKRDGDGVVFSTIHKAKGLQADNVYLIQPELIPSSKAITAEEIQQENNIFFVAYTRNMKKMYLVNKD
jgi:superfamily I DNA/RNA helicase